MGQVMDKNHSSGTQCLWLMFRGLFAEKGLCRPCQKLRSSAAGETVPKSIWCQSDVFKDCVDIYCPDVIECMIFRVPGCCCFESRRKDESRKRYRP